mmetsp:Transcript_1586/g.3896  ORF Transcript_1586/g.3896 Transcript_1586/m.3896 type:complete len:376 (+) Transcript_1586:508-1635(+)
MDWEVWEVDWAPTYVVALQCGTWRGDSSSAPWRPQPQRFLDHAAQVLQATSSQVVGAGRLAATHTVHLLKHLGLYFRVPGDLVHGERCCGGCRVVASKKEGLHLGQHVFQVQRASSLLCLGIPGCLDGEPQYVPGPRSQGVFLLGLCQAVLNDADEDAVKPLLDVARTHVHPGQEAHPSSMRRPGQLCSVGEQLVEEIEDFRWLLGGKVAKIHAQRHLAYHINCEQDCLGVEGENLPRISSSGKPVDEQLGLTGKGGHQVLQKSKLEARRKCLPLLRPHFAFTADHAFCADEGVESVVGGAFGVVLLLRDLLGSISITHDYQIHGEDPQPKKLPQVLLTGHQVHQHSIDMLLPFFYPLCKKRYVLENWVERQWIW